MPVQMYRITVYDKGQFHTMIGTAETVRSMIAAYARIGKAIAYAAI